MTPPITHQPHSALVSSFPRPRLSRPWRPRRLPGLLLVLALGLGLAAGLATLLAVDTAWAAVITVNSTADNLTGGDGSCTLREAIMNANSNADTTGGDCAAGSGADIITLPAGTYTLAIAGTNDNANASGDLDATDAAGLTLNGAGATTTILDAAGLDRAFNGRIGPLALNALTVQNGSIGGYGGGIESIGALTLTSVHVLSNTTVSVNGGGGVMAWETAVLNGGLFQNNTTASHGGGLYAFSTLTLSGTQFLNNTAHGGGGGVIVFGAATLNGGLFQNNTSTTENGGGLYASTLLTLTGTQFLNNTAYGQGGGVIVFEPATLNGGLFQNNTAYSGGGAALMSTVSLSGTQFISNTAYSVGGGALLMDAATIQNATFQGNLAYDGAGLGGAGGGIHLVGNANVTVMDSTFSGNQANGTNDSGGGAIMVSAGTMTINSSSFENNSSAAHGGAISTFPDTAVTVVNGYLGNNSAAGNGGAIANRGELHLIESTLVLNAAIGTNGDGFGGGLWNETGATAEVDRASIRENTAKPGTGEGGGVFVAITSTLSLVNTTVYSNTAAWGGGLRNWGTLTAYNNTVSDNTATEDGGGLRNDGAASLTNTILAHSVGGDCSNTGTGTLADNDHNLIEDGSCNPAVSGDPLLGALGTYGGATSTLPLLSGSPAINAGNNATCIATDQRGVVRPQDGVCDIGAFEVEVEGYAIYLPVIVR